MVDINDMYPADGDDLYTSSSIPTQLHEVERNILALELQIAKSEKHAKVIVDHIKDMRERKRNLESDANNLLDRL